MIRKIFTRLSERYLARWVILVFDLFLVAISFAFAVVARFNFDLTIVGEKDLLGKLPLVVICYGAGFLVSRSFIGIVRHTNIRDARNIFRGSLFALALLLALSTVEKMSTGSVGFLFVPRSILLIHFLATIFTLIGSRFMVKSAYDSLLNKNKSKEIRVLLFGAGLSGMTTADTLKQDPKNDYNLLGFIDDNPRKKGKAIGGVNVFHSSKGFTKEFVEKHQPDLLIICVQNGLSIARKKEIVDWCLANAIQVKIVPPLEDWIKGELSTKQIKSVRIEELLERDPIELDNVNIAREIRGKVILVTGAAGSIGSEIARQVLHYKPEKVVLLDQAESPLYDLQQELKTKYKDQSDIWELCIADVTNPLRIQRAFEAFEPQIVFHAAAYKHVPLMEANPFEAINVNVMGTRLLADLSVQFDVEKFVMVSTDKAVNPTNVMGATKRCAEIYTQGLFGKVGNQTQFIITRFGNVLGSNGSVIPLFKNQIEQGGPITLTDKRITRYFMTIPEACNLVLEAGSMGNGGEVFVFDMGQAVRIFDLAKKMVMLSGLEVDKDIEIREVGLRPGEKLYEELLAVSETTKPTHHDKILIAQVQNQSFKEVKDKYDDLEKSLFRNDNHEMVAGLKQIVPEFISNNSEFASLDLKKIVND